MLTQFDFDFFALDFYSVHIADLINNAIASISCDLPLIMDEFYQFVYHRYFSTLILHDFEFVVEFK